MKSSFSGSGSIAALASSLIGPIARSHTSTLLSMIFVNVLLSFARFYSTDVPLRFLFPKSWSCQVLFFMFDIWDWNLLVD